MLGHPFFQVCTVKAHELANHIPVSSLPEHLGGSSQYSHIAWIQSCVNSSSNNPTNSPYATADCLGSLMRSYSLEQNQVANSNPITANTSAQVGATVLGDGLNSNCPHLDDGNANLQNHRHAHWNGSALPGSGIITGSNANVVNGRSRQPPPQSETPPDTPLHQKHPPETVLASATKASKAVDNCRQESNGAQDSRLEGDMLEEEVEAEDGVPPLPQKSSRQTPLSRSPVQDMSWLPGMGGEASVMSIHVAESGGMTVQELVQHIKRKKKKGIYQEYEEIRKEPPAGTFDYSK